MPTIRGFDSLETRLVNTLMSRAFFPRTQDWIYPELAGSFTSVSKIEPFSVTGSVPPITRYRGILDTSDIPDFSLQSPNLLWKNAVSVDQSKYEFDQTGTVAQLSTAIGIRLAEFPDQLFNARLLKGSNPADATVFFEGQNFNLTFDGVPFFAQNHPTFDGGIQSNILQGTLPLTKAALLAQDFPTTVSQLVRDLQTIIDAIKTVRDTKNIPLYPTIDTRKSIVVVVPPVLEPAAALAFRQGPADTVINQTTNIAPLFVKKVISSGYLDGFQDPDNPLNTAEPVNETDWYVFVVDDYVKPFYLQLFRPLRSNERMPPDFRGGDEVDAVLRADNGIKVDQATLFASTRIDTTFGKIGANADIPTIETERFLMSARYRGNLVYGPWFTGWRIKPVNGLDFKGQVLSS